MLNDPGSDIQIKAAGTVPAPSATQTATPIVVSSGTQTTSGTSTTPVATTAQPVIDLAAIQSPASSPLPQTPSQPVVAQIPSVSPSPAPVQPATTTSAPVNQQPLNKRAFNLDEGIAEATTGQAKPDKFAIPKIVRDKHPDLVELIKVTESMDDQERQYWFQILPVMTAEQVEKFRGILVTEKEQLAQLDKEYEDELNRLNDKHLLEWKEFESKEKSKAIKEAEAQNSAAEKQLEEDLLAKLSNV